MNASGPTKRRIGGIVLKLFGLLLSLYAIDAAWAYREAESERTLALQRELDDKQALLASHDAYAAQLQELRAMLAPELTRLPARLDRATLDKTLHDGATAASVDIVNATWGAEVPKEFYAEQPLDITLRGSSTQIAAFMNTYLREPPQRTATAMELTQDRDALRLRMTVLYHRYLEETE